MDSGTVSDDDIRAARDAWLLARPLGERDGPEYAFFLNLVQAQSRALAAAFRTELAGRGGRAGRGGPAGSADGAGRAGGPAHAGQHDVAPPD